MYTHICKYIICIFNLLTNAKSRRIANSWLQTHSQLSNSSAIVSSYAGMCLEMKIKVNFCNNELVF